MSSTNSASSLSDERASKNDLIEKILHQGQKLRNAMVQSILDHDPFNTEIFNDYKANGLVTSRLRKKVPSYCDSLDYNLLDTEKHKIKSFLKGESMNQRDQFEALETLRSMSSENLCKTTNEAYHSKCKCSTCRKYNKDDLNCDLKRFKNSFINEEEKNIQEQICMKPHNENEIRKYLKYVDCIQISIHALVLNDKGNKKVNSYLTADKQIPAWGSQTFFIEYELPFILSVSTSGKKVCKSYTNSSNNNFVRICARRISTEAVHFKHISVHNIKNVDQINLEGIKLKFQITCRTMKQKNIIRIGYVIFNFAQFESSSTLTCIEELPVNFDDTVPITLGKLHATFQLGYGRLYFGNEFIACFEENQKNLQTSKTNNAVENVLDQTLSQKVSENKTAIEKKNIVSKEKSEQTKINEECIKLHESKQKIEKISTLDTKIILFGFVYIPEAQYTKADISSFISCRPFCQEENCFSELVRNESNPIFNYSQLVPLIYDEELLRRFRDNFMVVEFWEKFETKNILLGLTKLPLNQFYLAYRNADITKYLLCNEFPVISSDWWEAIINPYTEELIGQAQVLLSIGTEKQIQNLQISRGFKTNSVQAKLVTPFEKNKEQIERQKSIREKAPAVTHKTNIQTGITEKVSFKSSIKPALNSNKKLEKNTKDQSVQFNSEMDLEVPSKEKEVESNDKLEQILNHLIAMRNQQQENSTEKETNIDDDNETRCDKTVAVNRTDNVSKKNPIAMSEEPNSNTLSSEEQYQNMPPLVRSTSDLLNTLQSALSVPPPKKPSPSSNQQSVQNSTIDSRPKKIPSSFKVHIVINQAMHLPIRKKCKAKRNKGKTVKLDDNVKPSSYVTFETMPGLDMKMTPLVQKSTSPEWNYKCDVILPSDLLTNSKKRLIFKVWRKSTNTNMVPNLQTDSIIGFAAVDLTVLASGLPNIKGWFNIIDLSSKCNGQINIHVTPLEDLAVFRVHRELPHNIMPPNFNTEGNTDPTPPEITNSSQKCSDDNMQDDEGDGELLSRALKRKFAELDEITQRLRLRLSHVTNEDTEEENDEVAEQFERDINTLSIEEDFDMVNFEQEATSNTPQIFDLLQIECSSDTSSEHTSVPNALLISNADVNVDKDVEESLNILDKQLLIGKHRIDTLLGKLSLISGDANTSRYISGCSGSNREESANIDTEAILKDLNRNSRPNINASTSYDKEMFQQIYKYPETDGGTDSNLSSNTSVISQLEESRPAPDGEGTLTEDRSKVKTVSI